MKNHIKKNKELICLGLGLVIITFIIYAVIAVDIDRKKNHVSGQEESTLKSSEDTLDLFVDSSIGNTSDDNKDTTDPSENISTSEEELGQQDDTRPEVPTKAPERPTEPIVYNYLIKVNRVMNCVTVYTKDASGKYTVPYKAMACSTAKLLDNTPLGTFNTKSWYAWCRMVDDTYGQYAYRIQGGIMFHSVPCFTKNYSDLEYLEYNKLGSQASLGCIRLTVADAKWICDNCPTGTTVIIYDDPTSPGPLGKPETIKIPENSPYRGWDPTDPNINNPWRNVRPSISGNSTVTVYEGSSVKDICSQMKAFDTCGNPIDNRIEISPNSIYNLNQAGTYNITLSVTDVIGKNTTKNITLIVKPRETPKPSSEDTTTEPDTQDSSTDPTIEDDDKKPITPEISSPEHSSPEISSSKPDASEAQTSGNTDTSSDADMSAPEPDSSSDGNTPESGGNDKDAPHSDKPAEPEA